MMFISPARLLITHVSLKNPPRIANNSQNICDINIWLVKKYVFCEQVEDKFDRYNKQKLY